MIAELGHLALILAFAVSLAGVILPTVGLGRVVHPSSTGFIRLAPRLAVLQLFLVGLAFAALMEGFLASDFSLKVVAANSHTTKPLLYKIAGVWGNHEGSLLLWVLILSLFGATLAWFGRSLPTRFKARVLTVQSFLSLGFLLFILLTSNPFDRLLAAPVEGNGLNPLLQDPGLAFHPPMLYLGYVGLSIAFSFAIAALIEGEVTPNWARFVRPWTLAAWIFLTGGIALGSWWAYYELGWGGWWFWDPVENASFMPWLAATALLHSAIVVEKRDALKSWTILLAIVAFSFSLLGTFLVRSGVLTSVHAFANDPERGLFILAFLAIVIGGSLTLYAWRANNMSAGGLFATISREGALVLNNILLATFAAVVLVGTLYPLVLEAVGGDQISVGPPFFNFAAVMLMAPLIIAVGFGPFMAWKRAKLGKIFTSLVSVFIVAVLAAMILLWQSVGDAVMSAFGLGLSVWLIGASLLEVASRLKINRSRGWTLSRFWSRLRSITLAQWGMTAAHIGLGVIVMGISVSETFTDEALKAVEIGEAVPVGAFVYRFDGVIPVAGAGYSGVRATFTVLKDAQKIATLYPEDRVYAEPPMTTTEAAIWPLVSGDLYAVIGDRIDDSRWSVRLYFKPLVSMLWLGSMMMMAGGALSLFDRRLRLGVPERRAVQAKTGKTQAETALSGQV